MINREDITIEQLQKSIANMNYKWFEDQINLIAIRTKEQIPDVFNDYLCIVWKQKHIPEGLNLLDTQKWLNANKFLGKDNLPLKEDGVLGANTMYAVDTYDKTLDKCRLKVYTITTEPGVYYQKNLLNKDGCWVMMPNQMLNAYKAGYHQSKSDHRALRSVGRIYGLREDDKDGVALNDKNSKPFWIDGHLVGANIHGADKKLITKKVGPWSAGCIVVQNWEDKEEIMDIADIYKSENNGLITFTLIEEKDYII